MTRYNVTGMSCAACSARVEKAVRNVPGVSDVAVSLLTNSMSVEGKVKPADVIAAVEKAGYGASLKDDEKIEDTVTKMMIVRLVLSVIISAFLMYVCMSKVGFDFSSFGIPESIDTNKIMQVALALIVMAINYKYFVNGIRGILHGAPNMDTLVSLGSLAGFIYGYYDSAAMILALIDIGKTLEAASKGRTTNAVKSLMKLTPQVNVSVGEIFEVKPGESIPADAVVIEGISAVDESALTGESIPADKSVGDSVSAGTINKSGYLKCKAVRVGNETTLSQIIKTVSDAASTKAPIARIADRIAGIFVPVVIGIAVVTFIIWIIVLNGNPQFLTVHGFTDTTIGFALSRAISVLVVSCPCALGLATPVAIMVGNGVGAKNGILFKNSTALENAGKVEIVALDKTGTITSGRPVVTDIITMGNRAADVARALESKSEHPLARAVVEYIKPQREFEVLDFKSHPGNGVSGTIEGVRCYGGSRKYIETITELPEDIKKKCDEYASEGKTPMIFATDHEFLGIIAVADSIKSDSADAIRELKNLGLRVVMITGDNAKTAESIALEAGVDEVIAGVLPNEKAAAIKRLRDGYADDKGLHPGGKVLMVGDGINDAPALTGADIGVAIGAGTDVAIDAAQIVLMKSSLIDVPAAIRLSRSVIRNIHQNLFWAFCYNIIGIPLAAGALVPLTGWTLNPMFCAAAMSVSSFIVCMNALRLNFVSIYSEAKTETTRALRGTMAESSATVFASPAGYNQGKNRATNRSREEYEVATPSPLENIENSIGGAKMYKTTIEVTGMMCPHCEAHTNEAITKAFDIKEVKSDHIANQTVILSAAKLDEAKLAEVIKEAGYEPGNITVEEA